MFASNDTGWSEVEVQYVLKCVYIRVFNRIKKKCLFDSMYSSIKRFRVKKKKEIL